MTRLNLFALPLTLFFLLTGPVLAEKTDWRSPLTVEGTETVDVPTAQQLHAEGVAFVDVRNDRLFTRRHIPGAHHLELKSQYNEQALSAIVARDQPVVLYCSGIKCSRSYHAAEMAVDWGFTQVKYFRDGVVGWKKAGLPFRHADGTVRPLGQ